MIGVTRLRAARVMGFNVVLEPLKAAPKLSKFGYSNTKTPIIPSNKLTINQGYRIYPIRRYKPLLPIVRGYLYCC